MTNSFRYTLIADGSSDKALMSIIKWVVDDLFPTISFEPQYADFRNIANPPQKGDINRQVKKAHELFPFDILFYHRDAELSKSNIIEQRVEEIKKQLDTITIPKTVCIIPVKMMELWLLFDETAIKKAAGNRNYSGRLGLPPINKIEAISNPKSILHDILKTASGRKGRNLKTFNVHHAVHLVADNIHDFTPLRQLPAFQLFEEDLKKVIDSIIKKNSLHIH